MNKTFKYLLAFILIISFLTAGNTALNRHGVEKSSNGVEITIDYNQVWEMAQRRNMGLIEILKEFKNAGATGIFFKEQTSIDLKNQGLAYIKTGSELLTEGIFPQFDGDLNRYYTYFITPFPEVHDRLQKHLGAKIGNIETITDTGEGLFIVGCPVVTDTMLGSIGLGFPEEGFAAAEKTGLNIIPQIRSWPEAKDAGAVKAVFEQLKDAKNISTVAFNDKDIPGFPGLLPHLEGEVKALGVPAAIIEFFPQKGLSGLIHSLDKNAVRLHSIGSDEMSGISRDRALDRYTLAVSERNVRVLYLRLFTRLDGQDWLQENLSFIDELTSGLEQKGFVLGAARPFSGIPFSRFSVGLLGLGVIAAGLLLLERIGINRNLAILGVLAPLGWVGLLFLNHQLARKLMALTSVIIFPTLAVITTVRPEGRGVFSSILTLLRTSLISVGGALLAVGMMAGTDFLLKIDQFLGVKFGILVPLLLIPLFIIAKDGRGVDRLREILNSTVQYKWAFLIGILGLVGIVLILRSGNDTGLVSGLEIRFRSVLNDILVVRPRTKEFLIGHPLMLLSYYLGTKGKRLPLVTLGAIGQVSLVNTFEHFHTPLVVSLLRTVNGLWLGIIIGVVVIYIYKLLMKLEKRYLNA
ncbi:MAG: hypothetical protein GX318_09150 [Clostridia bacterium]|nr:hypothetical protein [Clostridia bacterium]